MSTLTFEKDFSKHPLHYFALLCSQVLGLWGVFWFSYNKLSQLVVIALMAICYVIWGIFHHRSHGDLHINIVFEYILVALLAVLIFGSLLLNS